MTFVRLSSTERDAFIEAVLSAVPSPRDLDRHVRSVLGINPEEIDHGRNYRQFLDEVATYVDTNERTPEFVAGLRRQVPGNSKLREFEAAYHTARRPADAPPAAPPLPAHVRSELVATLTALPQLLDAAARDCLLTNIPEPHPTNRNPHDARADLLLLVDQLAARGGVTDGPLAQLVANALPLARAYNPTLATRLAALGAKPADHASPGEPSAPTAPPAEPEALVYAGEDVRQPRAFLDRALATGRSVARLEVPRYFEGTADGLQGWGTGWLIAPTLVITNDHVINARGPHEPRAKPADYRQQAKATKIRFDFYELQGAHVEVSSLGLPHDEAFDEPHDVALLRIAPLPASPARAPIPIVRVHPTLHAGSRLNIVQHPYHHGLGHGDVQKYAFRNNFFVSRNKIAGDVPVTRYLTDTEPGASGSPVLDDEWRAVALHHSAVPIAATATHTLDQSGRKVARFHNEGVDLHAILAWLKGKRPELHAEITAAQGWT